MLRLASPLVRTFQQSHTRPLPMKRNKPSSTPFETLAPLRQQLLRRVRAQEEVVYRLADTIERRETEVVPQRGARGAFIFAGPTGVGKTLLATTVAETLFGADRLVRID